jgi:hypothetical protein
MTVARYDHAAVLLPNGKVLIAGGLNSVGTAELYDPTTATWAATGPMNHGRYFYTATLLPNGRALVAGGDDNSGYFAALYAAELYVPAPVVVPSPWFDTSAPNLRLTTNGFRLQVDGVLATNSVVIYASTNSMNWLPILTNGPATGSVSFLDAAATNWPRRFYRAAER